jgi:hypothetical protein
VLDATKRGQRYFVQGRLIEIGESADHGLQSPGLVGTLGILGPLIGHRNNLVDSRLTESRLDVDPVFAAARQRFR